MHLNTANRRGAVIFHKPIAHNNLPLLLLFLKNTFMKIRPTLPLTKRISTIKLVLLLAGMAGLTSCSTPMTLVGPQGHLSAKLTLPDGFQPEHDTCTMVILMHGIFSSKDYAPMPTIARRLAKAGIGSVRFDFNDHGKSDGRMEEMTIARELADARAVWDSVTQLLSSPRWSCWDIHKGASWPACWLECWHRRGSLPTDWCFWRLALSSKRPHKGDVFSDKSSTPITLPNTSNASIPTSWAETICCRPNNWTFTAPLNNIRVQYASFMVQMTASCRYGAARNITKDTTTAKCTW